MTRKCRQELQRKCFQQTMVHTESMRQESLFTDVIIQCEHNTYPVHRVIVSASSSFFKELFQKNPQETHLIIDFVNSRIFEIILNFIYSGRLKITNEASRDFLELLEASLTLGIPLLSNHCLEQLLLNNHSLLSQWNLVEQWNNDRIRQLFYERVLKNFNSLKETQDFLKLPLDHLKSILSHPLVSSVDQKELVGTLVAWVKYDRNCRENSISCLLEKTQLEKISDFMELMEEPILANNLYFNQCCLSQVKKSYDCKNKPKSQVNKNTCGMEFSSCTESAVKNKPPIKTSKKLTNDKRDAEVPTPELNSNSTQGNDLKIPTKNSLDSKRILWHGNVGGYGIVFEFNHKERKWERVEDHIWMGEYSNSIDSSVCAVGKYIYYFGGTNKKGECFRDSYIFDILKNKWNKTNERKVNLCYSKAVELNGFIYVLGGRNKYGDSVKSVERFDIKTHLWGSVADLPFGGGGHPPVVAVDGYLCFVGDSHLHWFSLLTNEWKQGEPLPRYSYGYKSLAQGNGNLFIIEYNSKCVEIYNIKDKSWKRELIPRELYSVEDIINLENPLTLEFLVVSWGGKCFLYRPPSTWESFPSVKCGQLWSQLAVIETNEM